jgi:hypothetical protein
MIKNIFTLFFICISLSISSQENLFVFQNDLQKSTLKIDEIFNIVNKSNNNVAFTLADSDSIYNYLFDEKFNKLSELKSKKLPGKFKIFQGSSINNNTYSYYFSNNINSKFGVYSIDFNLKTATSKKIDLNFEKELYIQSLTLNDVFYLLSVNENSSTINVYKFSENTFEKKTLDLSQQRFLSAKNKISNLYNIFKNAHNIAKIKKDNALILEDAFSKIKIYSENDSLKISIDESFSLTQLISIDLNLFSFELETIKQPYLQVGNTIFKKSNSFLIDDLFFQIVSSSKTAKLKVSEYSSGKDIKEYQFSIGKNITFNPVKEETKKAKKNSKAFLRKLSSTTHQMGISVVSDKNKYQIKFGSYILGGSGGMNMTPGFGSWSMSSGGSVSFSPGSPSYSYNSYGNSSIISDKITGTFDKNLNYINSTSPSNLYDSAISFEKKNAKRITAKTIFWYDGNLILVTSVKGSKDIRLIEFVK